MKIYLKLFLVISCAFFFKKSFADSTSFSTCDESIVRAEVNQSRIKIEITEGHDKISSKTIDLDLEKSPSIKVGDYDFDGCKDLSINYIDEGMGTYLISRLFIYDKIKKDFFEVLPKCGDQFINLKINKTLKALSSAYYVDNEVKVCRTKSVELKKVAS